MGKLQLVQRRFDQFDFIVVGCGDVHGQWSPLGIDNVDDLAALSALGVADAVPPFFARANQASAAASLQSMWPSSSSCSSSIYLS